MSEQSAALAERGGAIGQRLAELAAERWPAQTAAALAPFARRYVAGVPPEDLEARSDEALYGAMVAHWRLGRQRSPGEAAVGVYSPEPERHGWESSHTVVDVVTDDRPFLVDSVVMALQRRGVQVHLIVHPILPTQRDAAGRWLGVEPGEGGRPEAYMHLEVDRCSDPAALEALRAEVAGALADVRAVVDDWGPMRQALRSAAAELARRPPPGGADELEEVQAFLDWVAQGHFVFLGYRCYELVGGDEPRLAPCPETALGLMRTAPSGPSARFDALPPASRRLAVGPQPLILTQASARSPVHRDSYMDYIGVKRFNEAGEVVGEERFLGLYASSAYHGSARRIPLLRRKVEAVLERAGYAANSHAGKALLHTLETFPRDELFQIGVDDLERIATAILHLQGRKRVRLLVRYDDWQRFVSCLVFLPRERYDTRNRRRIRELLEQALGASRSDFRVQLGDTPLARLHFVVRLPEPGLPALDVPALEQRLREAVRSWEDRLHEALLEAYGEERGNRLAEGYAEAFSAAYREDVEPRSAVADIARIEGLEAEAGLAMAVYRPAAAAADELRFRLLHSARPATLSDTLPILEHMGVQVVDERPYAVAPVGRPACWIHDFGLRWEGAGRIEPEAVAERFAAAFAAVWRRRAEDDGLNRLVLAAGLAWQEVALVRALVRYLRQAGLGFSQDYIEEALAAHPRLVALLVAAFHGRFDPERGDAERAAECTACFQEALAEVPSLDADRILRRLQAAVAATARTNYYAAGDGALALKLHPAAIPGLPRPVPWAEIFVYAPGVEGVHLRGGEVARGGIRWSDRREDFRTEVLGLMKAQTVKNAAIVPVGAKGGFVLKRPPPGGPGPEQVRAAYRAYIEALLEVTDNLVGGEPRAPARVVRHDGPDPYLVVAADKGTARLSDLANEVAGERGFWLGDAFASGGSSGYDHKGMAITARGAWQAVQRHFRELGRDVQREPLSVVGVGDMSGDVFGNGMLRSPCIRLLAAFDHRHVFIDPDPDPEAAYAERQRLFRLEGSSWDDYDRAVLSSGGAVYSRGAKSVALEPPARRALGIEAESLTPDELIQAVLRAPVDLLWNGGIGTYVKASSEGHAEVGDKGTDAVRVDAAQLRCRVVGEGGNLGLTQRARVEYAAGGGRINTDAIDNVGGVACSDYEVNIKILLAEAIAAGELDGTRRDALLAEMREEVAGRVLETCAAQTEALSLSAAVAAEEGAEHAELIRRWEREGTLDRELEGLPGDDALAERTAAGEGLLRPELAVLHAYAKIAAQGALLAGDLPGEPAMERWLLDYFPRPLAGRYPERIRAHRLRRELIATAAANRVVDRMGPAFFHRLERKAGAGVEQATRAWSCAGELLAIDEHWAALEALDGRIAAAVQTRLLLRARALHEHATLWLLRNHGPAAGAETGAMAARLRPQIERLAEALPGLLPAEERARAAAERQRLEGEGVPAQLAGRAAVMPALYVVLDLLKVAEAAGAEPLAVAGCYYGLVEALGLSRLRRALVALAPGDGWQQRFRDGLQADYDLQVRGLTAQLLRVHGAEPEAVERFLAERAPAVERLRGVLAELDGAPAPSAAMLAVAVQELKALVQLGDARRPAANR